MQVMREKSREMDLEIHFKDAFRAFSKDDEGLNMQNVLFVHIYSFILQSTGCIPADELKFVMAHLPGKVS